MVDLVEDGRMTNLIERIEAATGLTRTRLAELLYEHEGFVDIEHGRHAPDREVPEWIESEIAADIHAGDCTKLPAPCMRCHADMALEQWAEFVGMIERAALRAREDSHEG